MPLDPNETVTIQQSEPGWPNEFERLATALRHELGGLTIEHLGSTAVPGLAAKPILDLVIAYADAAEAAAVRKSLEGMGYANDGEKGIAGREAFRRLSAETPTSGSGPWMDHHLYLAARTSEFVEVQLRFRDYLRAHPETAVRYGTLKHSLAAALGHDRVLYTNAKGPFVGAVLAAAVSDPVGRTEPLKVIEPEEFSSAEMRVGTVISAQPLPNARRAAIVMEIDFGTVGVLITSAQITDHYAPGELLGRQVVAVVNLPPKQIGSRVSRCLVLGASDGKGIVLLGAEKPVPNGSRVH
jgi:export-related chaperone CsaA